MKDIDEEIKELKKKVQVIKARINQLAEEKLQQLSDYKKQNQYKGFRNNDDEVTYR